TCQDGHWWMFKIPSFRGAPQLLAQCYHADEELQRVAAELDSFDGRREPRRCMLLVNQLRTCQDRVLVLIGQIMEACIPTERADRDFCAKFPDEVRHDGLAGQLWFGAECLAAGSIIMNREVESLAMRPLARQLTRALEDVRSLLRDQCLRDLNSYPQRLRIALCRFDELFAEFELSYVSAMVPVKSPREYDIQQDVVVLFCETIQRALRLGYLTQEMIDDYDPALMFTIPRLAIIWSVSYYDVLLHFTFVLLLVIITGFVVSHRDLLRTLTPEEQDTLERSLCASLDHPSLPGTSHPQTTSPSSPNHHVPLPTLPGVADSLMSSPEPSVPLPGYQVDLACSLQFDAHEQAEISALVHRAGSVMHCLLSPPSSNPSPARRGRNGESNCRVLGSERKHRRNELKKRKSILTAEENELGLQQNGVDLRKSEDELENDEVAFVDHEVGVEENERIVWDSGNDVQESDENLGECEEFLSRVGAAKEIANRTGGMCLSATVIFRPRDDAMQTNSACITSTPLNHSAFNCNSTSPGAVRGSRLDCAEIIVEAAVSNETSVARGTTSQEALSSGSGLRFEPRLDSLWRVCILLGHPVSPQSSRVADQLQTNYASDLRTILKVVFEVVATKSEPVPDNLQEQDAGSNVYLEDCALCHDLISTTDAVSKKRPGEFEVPPEWVPDEECNECAACCSPFTVIRRKHHCRNCGKIFCSRCSPHSAPLPRYGQSRPVRVCMHCFLFHVTPFCSEQSTT
uniref:Lateral signaling target protein 2 homolog n=1 Tax=Eptatretus burgeri TaxID=7764 RepID=A0A8C4Q0F0_EPTBU